MELVISGRDATVSGVTFDWSLRCPWCRELAYVSRDDGKVRAGLDASGSGRTCRCYQRDVPGRMPVPPAQCPHCGQADPYRGYPSREATAVMHGCEALHLLDQAYREFRAGFAAEAARADEAMLRALRR
jgi:hypothetical protein